MDNPEIQAALHTRHRTKTNKAKIQLSRLPTWIPLI